MRPPRSSFLPLALLFLAVSLGFYWHINKPMPVAHAQTVRLTTFATLTLTGSLQQVSSASNVCTVLQFYAPGSGSAVGTNVGQVIVGDSNISASGTGRGIPLVPGAARSVPAVVTTSLSTVAISTMYAIGTSGDHLMFDCWN